MAVFPRARGLLGRIFGNKAPSDDETGDRGAPALSGRSVGSNAQGDGATRDPGAASGGPWLPTPASALARAATPVQHFETQVPIFPELDGNGDTRDAGDGACWSPGREIEQARLPGPDDTRDPGDAESPEPEPGLG